MDASTDLLPDIWCGRSQGAAWRSQGKNGRAFARPSLAGPDGGAAGRLHALLEENNCCVSGWPGACQCKPRVTPLEGKPLFGAIREKLTAWIPSIRSS